MRKAPRDVPGTVKLVPSPLTDGLILNPLLLIGDVVELILPLSFAEVEVIDDTETVVTEGGTSDKVVKFNILPNPRPTLLSEYALK